jgi:hypothetical protein
VPFSGLWGLAVMGMLVRVIILSYAIDGRSRPKPSWPQNTRWIENMLNLGVARDAETQKLRREMLLWLTLIALSFAGLGGLIWLSGGFAAPPRAG